MSLDDTSSLSEADSLYHDIGPMTPPLSPKHIQVVQADVYMPLPHVQSQPQQGTQCVKTK